MFNSHVTNLLQIDQLSILMICMVSVVGLSVGSFASRYLEGDAKYKDFYLRLTLLVASIFIMVSANHILIFLAAWSISNFLLLKLMIHKSNWKSAYQSGILAGKNFIFGFFMLGAALALLYGVSGQITIDGMLKFHYPQEILIPALILLLISAMTQSAIWPFHCWLISSLNSPTPVSALMHAGLVNGGGFLLVRFAPLYLDMAAILDLIFIIGMITALLGTLWKLMQSDVKRMLACSTMAQMGFMFSQCGLGLFAAAIAHLCWHGFFKAYLFLASSSAAQEKRLELGYPPRLAVFFLAMLCGLFGSIGFAFTSHKDFVALDTNLVLIFIAGISGVQFAMRILNHTALKKFPAVLIATSVLGCFYGASVCFIEGIIQPVWSVNSYPLSVIHIAGLMLFIATWLTILFSKNIFNKKQIPDWLLKFYVIMLNTSQPHSKTVTTYRNQYQYL